MSSSRPQESTCQEVLQEVYLYLDLECTDERRALIRRHLERCSGCMREYGIEQEVKDLVARCCGSDTAPAALRERLRRRLSDLASRGLPERMPD